MQGERGGSGGKSRFHLRKREKMLPRDIAEDLGENHDHQGERTIFGIVK